MYAAGLQVSPWGFRDHLNGCLLASGLLHLVAPSLTTSVAHKSYQQGGRLVERDDATVWPLKPGVKLPTWPPVPPELWRRAEKSLLGLNTRCFEPTFGCAAVSEEEISFGSWAVNTSTGRAAERRLLPPRPLRVLWSYDGLALHGDEYLTISEGSTIFPSGRLDESGWRHGTTLDGLVGWYPVSHAA